VPPLRAWPLQLLLRLLDSESFSRRTLSESTHLVLVAAFLKWSQEEEDALTPLTSSCARYTKENPPSPKTFTILTGESVEVSLEIGE
jgi:hypothetical protein